MTFLILIPIITSLLGLFIYKFQGKSIELFRLDSVQFIYLFVVSPTLFVWLKSFLFYLLKNEIEYTLTHTEMFIIDTAFSVVAVFIMAAIAIHSLTKTFWIKRHHDPDFDIYHLSEYFHLWLSHILIWGGTMLIITFIGLINSLVPLDFYLSKPVFIGTQAISILFGVLLFFSIWMSDSGSNHFMKLMKLLLISFAIVHIIVYFTLSPKYDASYIAYWFSITVFVTATILGSFVERYEKVSWLRSLFLHAGWGDNKGIVLFPSKKKNE